MEIFGLLFDRVTALLIFLLVTLPLNNPLRNIISGHPASPAFKWLQKYDSCLSMIIRRFFYPRSEPAVEGLASSVGQLAQPVHFDAAQNESKFRIASIASSVVVTIRLSRNNKRAISFIYTATYLPPLALIMLIYILTYRFLLWKAIIDVSFHEKWLAYVIFLLIITIIAVSIFSVRLFRTGDILGLLEFRTLRINFFSKHVEILDPFHPRRLKTEKMGFSPMRNKLTLGLIVNSYSDEYVIFSYPSFFAHLLLTSNEIEFLSKELNSILKITSAVEPVSS